jgi:hypothetical protein
MHPELFEPVRCLAFRLEEIAEELAMLRTDIRRMEAQVVALAVKRGRS